MTQPGRGLDDASRSTGGIFEFLVDLALAPLKTEMVLEIVAEVAEPMVLLVAEPMMLLEILAEVAEPMVLLLAEILAEVAEPMVLLAEVVSPPPPTIESATLAALALELSARRRMSEDFE